jgi:hypothetical protein
MAGMRPEEARQFYEEDEDPARVFALFDGGEKGRTAPPRPSDPIPLRQLLGELARELRELRLRDRIARGLRRLADAIQHRTTVG